METGVRPGQKDLSDAELLIKISGVADSLAEVSPVRLKTPASPYQASQMEKRPTDIKAILRQYHSLADKHEYMLVEGVGGILTPITAKYKVVDLVRDIGLPVIVVSRYTLGTLNHTLLTLNAAREAGLTVRGVIFNQTTPSKNNEVEKGQPDLIRKLSTAPVLGECPFIKDITSISHKQLDIIEKKLGFDKLLRESTSEK